jgi:hypothetical protein
VAVLKVVPIVKPAEILALLNLKPVDPATFLKVRHYYEDSVGPNEGRSVDVKRLFRRSDVLHPEECERRIIATQLRQYVDEWAETGWADDGGESPGCRSLIKAPLAMRILRDYTSHQKPQLRFLGAPPEFVVEVGFSEDYQPANITSAFVDPVDRVRSDVARLFFGLIISDWGPHLSKCRHCGRYFVHPKPRRSYKNGTFCSNQHQMSWNATRRGREKRRFIHSALLDIAAAELMRRRVSGPRWQNDRSRKIQLANDVSAWIRENGDAAFRHLRFNVKLTWVTRNRQEIEKRRRELSSTSPREVQAQSTGFSLKLSGGARSESGPTSIISSCHADRT